MQVAIVGATGAVGQELLHLLEERRFPLSSLRCFASERSKGESVSFQGRSIPLEVLEESSLSGIDLAFFCAGASVSRQWIPQWKGRAIDLSSAFRMEKRVPLVIPEINGHLIKKAMSLIASPNCATTLLLMPLFSLHRTLRIKRIVCATYQAASGAGARAMRALQEETRAHLEGRTSPLIFSTPYAFNLFPHNSPLLSSGYVEEEIKMVQEARKILEEEALSLSATCVRVPVLRAHALSANVEFQSDFSLEEVYTHLRKTPGVELFEERGQNRFATPHDATGRNEILCGRLRLDSSQPRTLELWVVGDQLRKGASLNAVQIAERFL